MHRRGKDFVCLLLAYRKCAGMDDAIWSGGRCPFRTFEEFLQRFREVFDHPKDGRSPDELLMTLSQGRKPAAEYALAFRTLAAQTKWTEDPLKVHYRKGLNHELQTELACPSINSSNSPSRLIISSELVDPLSVLYQE